MIITSEISNFLGIKFLFKEEFEWFFFTEGEGLIIVIYKKIKDLFI